MTKSGLTSSPEVKWVKDLTMTSPKEFFVLVFLFVFLSGDDTTRGGWGHEETEE